MVKQACPLWLKQWWRSWTWPRSTVSWLPGTSRSFGPARFWVGREEFCAATGGTFKVVEETRPLPPPEVSQINAIPSRFFDGYAQRLPEMGVFQVKDARLLYPGGWVVAGRDYYLLDASYWTRMMPGMTYRTHYMLSRRKAEPKRRLPGKVLSLASDFSSAFGHFIHDSLTRLYLLDKAGISLADFDHVYWPVSSSPAARAILEASGLDLSKWIGGDNALDYECEDLTVTSFPGLPGTIPPEFVSYLRGRFPQKKSTASRKLYLSRKGFRRNFRDDRRIQAALEQMGYETCDPLRDRDILVKCASATHVVTIEGANYFNLLTAGPGTRVLLILPDQANHLPYAISFSMGLEHRLYLLAARSMTEVESDPGAADIEISADEVIRAVAEMEKN